MVDNDTREHWHCFHAESWSRCGLRHAVPPHSCNIFGVTYMIYCRCTQPEVNMPVLIDAETVITTGSDGKETVRSRGDMCATCMKELTDPTDTIHPIAGLPTKYCRSCYVEIQLSHGI